MSNHIQEALERIEKKYFNKFIGFANTKKILAFLQSELELLAEKVREEEKAFISTERNKLLNEVRELIEGLGTYRTARNIETINKHDLLEALTNLQEKI